MENLEDLPKIALQDKLITFRPINLEDAETHLAGDDEEQIKWLNSGKSTMESVQNWIFKKPEILD